MSNPDLRRTRLLPLIISVPALLMASCNGSVDDPDEDLTTASVEVTPSRQTLELPAGAAQLTATARNAAGATLSGRTFTWNSSAPGIAAVDQAGRVEAVTPGTATITASTDGRSGGAQIDVVAARVASVQVSPAAPAITVGETRSLTATLRDAAGNVLTGRTIDWNSANASVVTVSQMGSITGLTAGTADVVATSEGQSGRVTVTVTAAPPPDGFGCGALINARIDAAAEVDVYRFNGTVGQRVLLTNTQTTANFNPLVHARATVLLPSGTQLLVFDSNAQRTIVLPETGTYTVRVNASNLVTTGGYALGLECLQPSPLRDAELVAGDLIGTTIAGSAEVDLYTFEGGSGDDVLFTLTQTTANFNPLTHARATVLTPGGSQLLVFDSNAQRRHTLPEGGTYVVYINASNLFTTGGYSLGFESLSPLGPTDGALGVGGNITGSIAAPAEVDVLTLSGQAGENVLLTLAQSTGFNSLVHARATVLTPSGLQLLVFDSNAQRSLQLPETGVYLVLINASNLFTTGQYSISRQ